MNNIFVYGSLMYHEVWTQLLPGDYKKQSAVLGNFHRVQIHQQTYPGLKADPGSQVKGVLVHDLSAADLETLDQFEGSSYCRESVSVSVEDGRKYQCVVYQIHPRFQHILTDQSWEPEIFENRYLKDFLTRYSNA